jgi:cobalt-zinc-cadmium efflux system outer membrane protein
VDSNERSEGGFEYGPGALFTLPIFNANRGGIARAEAELDRAMRNAHAIREQIVRDVTTAHAQAIQARRNLEAIRTRILPTVQTTIDLATRNFEEGGASYFLVLQTATQFLDARSRELDLRADLQKAFAELERSLGQRLSAPPSETDETPAPLAPQTAPHLPAPDSMPAEAEESGASFPLGCRPVKLIRTADDAMEHAAGRRLASQNVQAAASLTYSTEALLRSRSHSAENPRQSDAYPSLRDRAGSRLSRAWLWAGLHRTREASAREGADAPPRGAPRAGHVDAQSR